MYGLKRSEIDFLSKLYGGDIRSLPLLILNYRKTNSVGSSIGGHASVFSYKRRGISYYNDYTPVDKAGYRYKYIVKIPNFGSSTSFFFKKRKEKRLSEILTKMISNFLSSLSAEKKFRSLTEIKDKLLIPKDYIVHELYDEVEYNFKVDKAYLFEDGSVSLLVEHWVKTYPLLSRTPQKIL